MTNKCFKLRELCLSCGQKGHDLKNQERNKGDKRNN